MKLALAQTLQLSVVIWPFESLVALLCVPVSGQAVLYTHISLSPMSEALASWAREKTSEGIPGSYIWQSKTI